MKVNKLTREQAIDRCKELDNYKNISRLETYSVDKFQASEVVMQELMHIFDIKEDELK